MTDAVALIRTRLKAMWSTTPIAWTGVPFDPQDPDKYDSSYAAFANGGAWIYFDEDLPNDRFQASIGGATNREREIGGVQIHIFVPAKKGSKLAKEYATTIEGYFRWWRNGELLVRSPRKASSETDGDWYRYTLYIPYQVDNYHAAQ